MARILLANHWGGGTGHARRLRAIADALVAAGHEPVMALPDLVAAESVQSDVKYPILQGPFWRGRVVERKSTRSFADILASHGAGEKNIFLPMARGWDTLIDTLKPDLVLADYAPILCLVTRGRLPCAVVGVPFCVPVARGDTFPDLNTDAPTAYPEQDILQVVNPWLEERGLTPLATLPDIHPPAHSFAFGFAELDPYRDEGRVHPVRPLPRNNPSPLEAVPSTDQLSVFAYLSARHRPSMRLLAQLVGAGIQLRCFLRDHNRLVADKLRSVGVEVLDRPVAIAQALSTAHVYLHHGSGAAVEDGLLLGRPQICVPVDLEKRLLTQVLVDMGVGINLRTIEDTEVVPERVRECCADKVMHERAQVLARDFGGRFTDDPMPGFIANLETMLVS